MSINLSDNDNDPVLWRGLYFCGAVLPWSELSGTMYRVFQDMPPGTGDVPLMVFPVLPLKGPLW